MSYPSSIDSIPQPTSTSATNNPSAAGVSVAQTTAIIALENKLGTTASLPSAGTILSSATNGNSAWVAPATAINGLTTSNLSSTAGILGAQIANLAITATQIANATITATQVDTTSVATLTATQTLTNKTLTSPTIDNVSNSVMTINSNPVWQYLGRATNTTDTTVATPTFTLFSDLTNTITIPTGVTLVRIKVVFANPYVSTTNSMGFQIYDGNNSTGTLLQSAYRYFPLAGGGDTFQFEWTGTLTSGSHTINIYWNVDGGTAHSSGGTGLVNYSEVECC